MNDDKMKEIIQEVVAKHGILIGLDDPIMVLHTINEMLLRDSAANQMELLNKFKEELENISHRLNEDAKEKAGRILGAALTASQETMAKNMREGAEVVAGILRLEFKAVLTTIRTTKRIAIMNIVAASITILAAAMVLWGTI